eukprot:SAG22_NODE_1594_length_4038_cov_3.494034_1_plen_372_part_00
MATQQEMSLRRFAFCKCLQPRLSADAACSAGDLPAELVWDIVANVIAQGGGSSRLAIATAPGAEGPRHAARCAFVASNGRLFVWGCGWLGCVGSVAETVTVPRLVENLWDRGVQVESVHSAGNVSACISTEGQLFTWGEGTHGSLGHGGDGHEMQPRLVTFKAAARGGGAVVGGLPTALQAHAPGDQAAVVSVSIATDAKTMACVTATGHVFSWGLCRRDGGLVTKLDQAAMVRLGVTVRHATWEQDGTSPPFANGRNAATPTCVLLPPLASGGAAAADSFPQVWPRRQPASAAAAAAAAGGTGGSDETDRVVSVACATNRLVVVTAGGRVGRTAGHAAAGAAQGPRPRSPRRSRPGSNPARRATPSPALP